MDGIRFRTKMNGYDKDEVHDYLLEMNRIMEDMREEHQQKQQELLMKVEQLTEEMDALNKYALDKNLEVEELKNKTASVSEEEIEEWQRQLSLEKNRREQAENALEQTREEMNRLHEEMAENLNRLAALEAERSSVTETLVHAREEARKILEKANKEGKETLQEMDIAIAQRKATLLKEQEKVVRLKNDTIAIVERMRKELDDITTGFQK